MDTFPMIHYSIKNYNNELDRDRVKEFARDLYLAQSLSSTDVQFYSLTNDICREKDVHQRQ